MAGGLDDSNGFSSAEIFSPSRRNDAKISPNAPPNAEQRNPDVAVDSSGNSYVVWEDNRNSLDQNTWVETGNLSTERQVQVTALLNDGRVLSAGDEIAVGCVSEIEFGFVGGVYPDEVVFDFAGDAPIVIPVFVYEVSVYFVQGFWLIHDI